MATYDCSFVNLIWNPKHLVAQITTKLKLKRTPLSIIFHKKHFSVLFVIIFGIFGHIGTFPIFAYSEVRCGYVRFFWPRKCQLKWPVSLLSITSEFKNQYIICHMPFTSATASGQATNGGCSVIWTLEWRW